MTTPPCLRNISKHQGMNWNIVCLAQSPPPLSTPEKEIALWSKDAGILAAVGLGTLLILAFFAKQSFGVGNRRKRVSESRSVPDAASLPKIDKYSEKRRRKKRRRAHRPSNPTLSETGGLPPQQTKDADKSAAP